MPFDRASFRLRKRGGTRRPPPIVPKASLSCDDSLKRSSHRRLYTRKRHNAHLDRSDGLATMVLALCPRTRPFAFPSQDRAPMSNLRSVTVLLAGLFGAAPIHGQTPTPGSVDLTPEFERFGLVVQNQG